MYIAKNFFKQLQHSLFLRLVIYTAAFLFFFAFVIHLAEPRTFTSIWNSLWWTIVTAFTVGYGDLVPVTPIGKFIAATCIILGTGIISHYTVVFAHQVFRNQLSSTHGESVYTKKNHIIIIGWNERTRDIIKQLTYLNKNQSIVLIDGSLNQLPTDYALYFVKGDPTKSITLKRANIKECNMVIVTADQDLGELDADARTILTILTIRGENPAVTCIAEIETKQHYLNGKRAGADTVIPSYKFTSFSFLSLIINNTPLSMIYVEDNFYNYSFRKIHVQREWMTLTWKEVTSILLEKNILLIGYIENEQLVSPNLNSKVTHPYQLLVNP